MGEVDQFLDEVEAELARLTKENDDLRGEARRRRRAARRRPRPPPAPGRRRPEPRRPRAVAPGAGAPEPRGRGRAGGDDPGRDRCRGVQRRRPAARDRDPQRRRARRRGQGPRPTRSSARPAPRPSAWRPRPRPRPTGSRPTPAPAAQMLDSETAERRQQLFGDLEKEQGQAQHRGGEPARLRARVPLPAEELLHPAARGARRPRDGRHGPRGRVARGRAGAEAAARACSARTRPPNGIEVADPAPSRGHPAGCRSSWLTSPGQPRTVQPPGRRRGRATRCRPSRPRAASGDRSASRMLGREHLLGDQVGVLAQRLRRSRRRPASPARSGR